MDIRKMDTEFRTERAVFEEQFYSPYACKSADTKGRDKIIDPSPFRSEFIRDRDRIIHCKSFRRLKHKTQVFLSPEGDHYRTRLTHTLEVTQIARTIARALRLNEDLTEAIALGHDLGHTPFGHAGERALGEFTQFEHNKQSLRVVEKLEYDFKGMNLTVEVRDGILNHKNDGTPMTLEGKVVSYADRIAYINHDIDDAIRAGLLEETDLPVAYTSILGAHPSHRINTMILDIVKTSFGQPYVSMSPLIDDATNGLRSYMFEHIYTKSAAKTEESKAIDMLKYLYSYYIKDLSLLPEGYRNLDASEEQKVCDLISSFTDRYATMTFENLFIPKSWSKV